MATAILSDSSGGTEFAADRSCSLLDILASPGNLAGEVFSVLKMK